MLTYFWVFVPFFYIKNVKCSENQLANSGKWKLKCTCPKALFFLIHLLRQAGTYVQPCKALGIHIFAQALDLKDNSTMYKTEAQIVSYGIGHTISH